MAQDNTERDVNMPYWPGPNAAGMGKATFPSADRGVDLSGIHDTVYSGRNYMGHTKGPPNVGANAIGQPKAPNQP